MAKRKHLLFTSAGTASEFYNMWCCPDRIYDVFVCNYGDPSNKQLFMPFVDYYTERKGSKFQNFFYFWTNDTISIDRHESCTTELDIHGYESYFIVDDDIMISTTEINELFRMQQQYQLDLLQPSFCYPESVISHEITRQIPNALLHYTNFIEVTAPMFSHEALTKCMTVYDPLLCGFGVDLLFMWHLGSGKKHKYAVIDKISCINPRVEVRKIDQLQTLATRKKIWSQIQKKLTIPLLSMKTFEILRLKK